MRLCFEHNLFAGRRFAVLFFLLCGCILGLAQDSTEPRPAAPRRPNIVLIVADDLGYGDLGCYGNRQILTPNLDRMSAEGVHFTSFYAGSAVCSPSRAALMLGKHTGHLDIRGEDDSVLQSGDLTIARILKDAGYRTGLIGKWGLSREGASGSPQTMGFDEFAGFLDNQHAEDYYPEFLWRYDPPKPGNSGWDGRMFLHKNANGGKVEYSTEVFSKAAGNFIRINKPDEINWHRPFFLMLSFNAPQANNEEGRRAGNGMQVPNDDPYSEESWPQAEKNKAAVITRMDYEIGKLIGKLHQYNLASNTLVLFVSDNGPHKDGGVDPAFFKSSGNIRGIKRELYEGGIRVPMIAYWPGRIGMSRTIREPVAMWDVPATFAEIALTQWPTNTDSISFYPLLVGAKQTNRHESFYWEMHGNGFQQAARIGDWKAVRLQAGETLELYDLKTDPSEKQNVADKHPEVIARFERYFKTARIDSPKWPIKKSEGDPKNAKPDAK